MRKDGRSARNAGADAGLEIATHAGLDLCRADDRPQRPVNAERRDAARVRIVDMATSA